MGYEVISLTEAAQLTGLSPVVLAALAESGEVASQGQGEQLVLSRPHLLNWCHLFARIQSAVVKHHRPKGVGGTVSARSLVWMARAGFLSGRDRVRL